MLRKMKQLIKQYKFIDYLIQVEKNWNPIVPVDLTEPTCSYVKEVNKEGILVLPNFFSKDELDILLAEGQKLSENIDKYEHSYEDKSFRIHHADKASDLINEMYSKNELFTQVANAYYGKTAKVTDTVYQESYPSSQENLGFGSSGFHFDGVIRRFKVITYLSDVELENGPFTYIVGDNRLDSFNKLEKMKRQYCEGNDTAEDTYDHTYYSEKEANQYQLNERATPFTAKAGTVIMLETRGLHVAGKITEGCRKVMVNYYK